MKKKIAIAGYGGQGAWHARSIMAHDVVELIGIYDPKPERNTLARQNGIVTFASYDELLASDADIVVIATPNDVHKELCVRAMDAKKSVICEKPVTMSVSDFDEITAAEKRNGVVFMVHQNRRWDTDFLAVKDLIETEKIGKPLFVASYVHGSRGIPGDWRQEKRYGGGMILDWGVHLIDQMLQLIKSPISSLYCMETHYTNSEVDDGFKLYLNFECGVTTLVEVGTYNFISLPRFYAQFEQGTAEIVGWNDNVHVKECLNWGEGDVHPVQTASGITKTMAPRTDATIKDYIIPKGQSDVHDFYRNFVAAMDGKEEKRIKNCEVRRVLEVIQAAFESAKENQVKKFAQGL